MIDGKKIVFIGFATIIALLGAYVLSGVLVLYFTIKRINKGLKPSFPNRLSWFYFTIKRINKGLKRFPCRL